MHPLPAIQVQMPLRANSASGLPRIETLDMIAIDRVLDGDYLCPLTPAERREAIRQGYERGWGINRIMVTLSVSGATVRAALDEPVTLIPA